jgi:curved DNA-binding protein CbpA
MRNFKNITCIEELKKQYFALAKNYHSDLTGGSDEKMKEINAEYDELFKRYKDVHASHKEEGETYTAKEPTTEAPDDFKNIISALLRMGLSVELCGRWLWIGGDTKPHKDELKALGCKWSSKKKLWSWHYPEDTCRGRKGGRSMDYIRNVYGSTSFEAGEQLRLGA